MEMTIEQQKALAMAAARQRMAQSMQSDEPSPTAERFGPNDPSQINPPIGTPGFSIAQRLANAFSGMLGGIPQDVGTASSGAVDTAGGVATGVAASLPGMPGNMASLAASLPNIAAMTMGRPNPISQAAVQPYTSSGIANSVMGQPANESVAMGRTIGDVFGPSGIAKLLGGVSRLVMPNRGVPPETVGTNYVADTIKKAGQSAADLQASDKPIMAAEALGPQAQTNLMALARRPGETADTLQASLATRAADRASRIQDDLATAAGVHPAAAKGDIEGLVQAGQAQAAPLFRQALDAPGPVWNQDLARLAQRPAVKKAIGLAIEDLKNADINPVSMGLEIDPMMGNTGAKQLQPTAQAWDLIRKALGRTVERDPFGKPVPDSISAGNHNVNAATRDLTGALKQAIPGYSEALDVSGDYLRSKSAFERGQSMILDNKVTEDQFAKSVSKLAPADLEALKGGIANKIFDLSQGGKLRPAQILTPRVQNKLATALGPDKAAEFIGNLEKEAAMRAFEMRAGPMAGSQTQPLTQAAKEQDTFGQTPVTAAVANVAQHGLRGTVSRMGATALQNVASRMNTVGMNEEARNQAGRLLMMAPDQLAGVLKSMPVPASRIPGLHISDAAMMSPQILSRLLLAQSVAGQQSSP